MLVKSSRGCRAFSDKGLESVYVSVLVAMVRDPNRWGCSKCVPGPRWMLHCTLEAELPCGLRGGEVSVAVSVVLSVVLSEEEAGIVARCLSAWLQKAMDARKDALGA